MRMEFAQSTKKARWLHCHDGKGIPHCEYCGGEFSASNPPEYHHHKEAQSRGDNSFQNCRVIGKKCCHVRETSRFKTECAKADRNRATTANLKRPSRNPIPGSRNTPWKRTMSGETVRR
jgi:5-methylcytosine-specific restriction enzyme A